MWSIEDTYASYRNGWSIFTCEDGLRLQKMDDPDDGWYVANNSDDAFVEANPYTGPRFSSDVEAAVFVQSRADAGDALCRKAIRFLIEQNSSSIEEFGLHL